MKKLLCTLICLCLLSCCAVIVRADSGSQIIDLSDSLYFGSHASAGIVGHIYAGTTVSELRALLGSTAGGELGFYSLLAKPLSEDALLSTGCIIQLSDGETALDTVFVAVTGDADGNGKVTAADARLALRHSARLTELGAVPKIACDVDFDGRTTASDARKILRAAAGLQPLDSLLEEPVSTENVISVSATYVGEAPVAGDILDRDDFRVLVVLSDGSQTLTKDWQCDLLGMTSQYPGFARMKITSGEASCELMLEFKTREAELCYGKTIIPDYKNIDAERDSYIEHYPDFIAYITPTGKSLSAMSRYDDYINYLLNCGFEFITARQNANQHAAFFQSPDGKLKLAAIYSLDEGKTYVLHITNPQIGINIAM